MRWDSVCGRFQNEVMCEEGIVGYWLTGTTVFIDVHRGKSGIRVDDSRLNFNVCCLTFLYSRIDTWSSSLLLLFCISCRPLKA